MTRKQPSRPIVDPELKRQLADAPAGASVQAVFTLRTPPGAKYLESAAAEETARQVVHEATAATKSSPQHVTVFPHTQSFVVQGPPKLVRAVLRHGAVASGMANLQREDLQIRPAKETSWRPDPTSRSKSSARPRNSRGRSRKRKR